MAFALDRMGHLTTAPGSPNEAFRAIHVVGTNGKPSTARMIAALLAQHGVHAGAYLSPHLVTFADAPAVGRELAGPDGVVLAPGSVYLVRALHRAAARPAG